MRLAIIDIGTNTVLMLVAETSGDSAPIILRDEHSIARLGEGVDKIRRISDAAYSRFAEIMRRYACLIEEYRVDRVVAFATSAMRDAENRNEVIERTKKEFGIDIELLSGSEEARRSFQGALFGVAPQELAGSVATIDIGGGSTEISVGENGKFLRGASVDIGAVRIKERFLAAVSEESVANARTFIREQLVTILSGFPTPHILIAVAGTPTSIAAIKHRLQSFDASVVDRTVIRRDELSEIVSEICSISSQELVRRYPAVSAARADILPAGALILEEAMNRMNVDSVRVSTKGVRYGILARECGMIQ